MKLIVIAVTLLLVAACKPRPWPLAADPSNPRAPVPPVRYQSTLGAYEPQRPVMPGRWRQQNEQVAPQPKGGNQ